MIEIGIVWNIRPLVQFYTLCFDSDIFMYENDKSSQYGEHNNLWKLVEIHVASMLNYLNYKQTPLLVGYVCTDHRIFEEASR